MGAYIKLRYVSSFLASNGIFYFSSPANIQTFLIAVVRESPPKVIRLLGSAKVEKARLPVVSKGTGLEASGKCQWKDLVVRCLIHDLYSGISAEEGG